MFLCVKCFFELQTTVYSKDFVTKLQKHFFNNLQSVFLFS